MPKPRLRGLLIDKTLTMTSIAVNDETARIGEADQLDESDRALIERFAQSGDEQAFEQLMLRYRSLVFAVCRRHLADHHDVEDAFQATFLVLAAKAGRVRWKPSIANWIYGVAFRIALKARARRAKRKEQHLGPMEFVAQDELNDVADQHAAQVVDEELNKLPEKYRTPLILCYLQGKTRRDAAKQLGCSEAIIKGRLERGRSKLRRQLILRGVTLSCAMGALGISQQLVVAAGTPTLVAATISAAVEFSTGGYVGNAVTANALSLAKGELSMTLSTLLKCAVVMLLVAALVSSVALTSASRAGTEPLDARPIIVSPGSDFSESPQPTLFVAAEGDAEDDEKASGLTGNWELVSAMAGGRTVADQRRRETRIVITEDRHFLIKQERRIVMLSFTMDASTTPKSIDLTDARRGITLPGIFKTENGELTICYNEHPNQVESRPTKFASESGQPHEALMTLKRAEAKPLSEDAKRMQGTWTVERAAWRGEELPVDARGKMKFVITDEMMIVREPNGKAEFLAFQLDPSKSPKWIDITEDNRVRLGIYEIKGDELKICNNNQPDDKAERPTEFKSEKDQPHERLIVLKRQ